MTVAHHYVKLFSNIVHSTIWDADAEISKLWVTMLALADPEGEVIMTIPGLARLARMTVESCESALIGFQQPDKHSWTKDNEGRRIEEIEGGWRLLNYTKYRTMLSEADRKAKAAARWKRWYERNKKSNASSNNTNALQTLSNADKPQVEVDIEVDVESQNHSARKARTHFQIPSLGEIEAYCQQRNRGVDAQQFFNHYTSNGWKVGRNAMKDWRAAVRTWERTKEAKNGKCLLHPESGLTPSGTCWQCYSDRKQT